MCTVIRWNSMSNKLTQYLFISVFFAILLPQPLFATEGEDPPKVGSGASIVPHVDSVFSEGPQYSPDYNAEAEQKTYSGRTAVPKIQRPLLEIGRRLYDDGPLQASSNLMGEKNPSMFHLMVFGDLRTAVAYSDNAGADLGEAAAQLNLNVDIKLTSTERLHAFFRPLTDEGNTRCEFSGSIADANEDDCQFESDLEPLTYFFEGDLGAIVGGIIGRQNPFDLPITFGKIPLLFQNGIWVEDAFLGAAFTIPARNSPALDISNFDVTFFAGVDDVTSDALEGTADDGEGQIYGVTAFLEAMKGYFEIGYGLTVDGQEGCERDYHNATISFTRRYAGKVSNSVRVIGNFGQEEVKTTVLSACRTGIGAKETQTADGIMVLLENSWITSNPTFVVPYLNLFYGQDRPQALAKNQGLLQNTGILFEGDGALTRFPAINDAGAFSYGGALGLEILGPALNWQVVLEVATSMKNDDLADDPKSGVEEATGVGIRAQMPLTNALIVRVNGMFADVKDGEDKSGATLEFRHKF